MKQVCVITGGDPSIEYALMTKFLGANYQVFNLDILSSDLGEYIHCNIANVQQVNQCINNNYGLNQTCLRIST